MSAQDPPSTGNEQTYRNDDSDDESGIEKRIKSRTKAHKDPVVLYTLYHERGLSQGEIGDRLGVCQQTISREMDRHSIETNTPPEVGTFSRPWRSDGDDEDDEDDDEDNDDVRYTKYRAVEPDGTQAWVSTHQVLALNDHRAEDVFGEGQVVHHRAEAPYAVNLPENLEVMTRSEHSRLTHHRQVDDPAERDTLPIEDVLNCGTADEMTAESAASDD